MTVSHVDNGNHGGNRARRRSSLGAIAGRGRRAVVCAGVGRGDAPQARREGARGPRAGRAFAREGREFFDRQRERSSSAPSTAAARRSSRRARRPCDRLAPCLSRRHGRVARRHGRRPDRPDRRRPRVSRSSRRPPLRTFAAEIKPPRLVEKVHRIADDAARATSLAAVQVERVDQFMASTTGSRRRHARHPAERHVRAAPPGRAVALARCAPRCSAFSRRGSRPAAAAAATRDEEDALFVG